VPLSNQPWQPLKAVGVLLKRVVVLDMLSESPIVFYAYISSIAIYFSESSPVLEELNVILTLQESQ